MNPKADFFFNKNTEWENEIRELRKIILDCGLNEEVKWGCPCYTSEDTNIVLIHVFKEYCALLFFKGVLLKDPERILIQQTKNVQSARQLRFTNVSQIKKLKATIKAYVFEAIEVEKAGLKVAFKKEVDEIPEELTAAWKKNPALKKAFKELTPGRQRGYILFFSAAKQSATRSARIEKAITDIMNGKGLND